MGGRPHVARVAWLLWTTRSESGRRLASVCGVGDVSKRRSPPNVHGSEGQPLGEVPTPTVVHIDNRGARVSAAEEPEKRHRPCPPPALSLNPRFLWRR